MTTRTFVESLVHDVRYALARLKRHPTFTVAAVLTLALGIVRTRRSSAS